MSDSKTNYIDPAALMRIKSLELRARVVMEGFWKGIHKSPYHGFSVEFSEYRQYTKGDDPRFIDWKVVARSDRVYIKKFEDETNLRCCLMVDQSKSMSYGSGEFSKAEYASTLAATLAHFMMGQGDAVGLTTFDDKVDQHIPPRNRPGHLRRMMLQLSNAEKGTGTDLAAPLKRIFEIIRKRSLLVLISDLLAPTEMLEKHLGYLAAAGHDLVVFQTLDPAEIDFTFSKATHFRDSESGKDLYIDPDAARAGYQKNLNAHLDSIHQVCERNRAEHYVVRTDQPMELALFDFVQGRRKSTAPIRAINRG
ncbi:DUF58 domain-containing protein [Verrucomicrobiales bacterium]|nr:DUF58 domain-containing protein [Verrucomicrobiales bacterium]MDB4662245.1 DUF58 domain-containing protein [Verrucomicrobiales bacterium]MDC0275706.1 DUF58 domain-containing protein [Verrucomicrobiales bacterium]MDC0322377.1 DUF58 domain-containing protein [Verrucomicrobiales bacterium]